MYLYVCMTSAPVQTCAVKKASQTLLSSVSVTLFYVNMSLCLLTVESQCCSSLCHSVVDVDLLSYSTAPCVHTQSYLFPCGQ